MKIARNAALAMSALLLLALPGTGFGETSLPERVARLDTDHPGTFYPGTRGQAFTRVRLNRPDGRICYSVWFKNLELRGLYLYRDGAEEPRDHYVKLYDEAPTTASPLKGCVTVKDGEVTLQQIRALKRHPKRFYALAFEYDGDDIAGDLRRRR
jgi:hypothetical protein